MGKSTEPAKCKTCGVAHGGSCADHNARGSLSARLQSEKVITSKRGVVAKLVAANPGLVIEGSVSKPAEARGPKESTAAGKDRQQQPARRGEAVSDDARPNTDRSGANPRGGDVAPDTRQPAAGTQAPPVDTPKKRGRPATGFDKKAYDRQKAAERRAKLKDTP